MNPAATLTDILRRRAVTEADKTAYTFLGDHTQSITWSQLHRRAGAQAAALKAAGAAGEPVLLALPSGIAFVESIFACWYAGAIATPVCLPRHQRVKHRLDRIIANAGARFAIGGDDVRDRMDGGETTLQWLDPNLAAGATDHYAAEVSAASTAVLQYTSGSTGMPRGVVVTHANLMANASQIASACGNNPNDNADLTTEGAGHVIGGWLPLFHDMGLVGLVVLPAFSGAHCVFMAPERFLMRPWSWLQMISDYRVNSSPAPNFAYDLCATRVTVEQKQALDLRCWHNALTGAEPVRAATLDRFAAAFASCGFKPEAYFPCYGLAEATLLVTGPGRDRSGARRTPDGKPAASADAHVHVGCGRPFGDTRLAIVDPQTRWRVAEGAIGEIWVAGASCANGYWNDAAATEGTFRGRLAGGSTDELQINWLRTGDLGYFVDGNLFITGRLRELIIIAGRNLFPVDIETAAESAHEAIASFGVAAFSVEVGGMERLVVAAEVKREFEKAGRGATAPSLDAAAIVRSVRAAIAGEHDVMPHEVVLLRSGALPRTTSGKLSRNAAKQAYLDQTLERLEAGRRVHAHV